MKTLKEIRKSRRMSRRKVAHILRIPTLCYTVYEKLPLFAELIPLTLEEIFISETEVKGYDLKSLLF